MGWNEITSGVFSRSYPQDEITVTVVRGDLGLLLVDTGGSPAIAATIRSDLRELGELRCVVNTHAHYDHTFGNQVFGPDIPIYGHHLLSAHLDEYERPRLAAWRSDASREPARDWGDVAITSPNHLITERTWVDLGAPVELIPLSPGHTDGDLVIRVPSRRDGGVDTWIVGDILEHPGPPMYGSGCYPMQWPETLSALLAEMGEGDVILPGHGLPLSHGAALLQLSVLQSTASLIRKHYNAGDGLEQTLSRPGDWAYPPEALHLAIERGYFELENP